MKTNKTLNYLFSKKAKILKSNRRLLDSAAKKKRALTSKELQKLESDFAKVETINLEIAENYASLASLGPGVIIQDQTTQTMKSLTEMKESLMMGLEEYEEAVFEQATKDVVEIAEISASWSNDEDIKEDVSLIDQFKIILYVPSEDREGTRIKKTLRDLAKEIVDIGMVIDDSIFAADAFQEMSDLLREVGERYLAIYKFAENPPEKVTTMDDIHARWPGEQIPTNDEIESFLLENGPFDQRKGKYFMSLVGVDRDFYNKMLFNCLLIPICVGNLSESLFEFVSKDF